MQLQDGTSRSINSKEFDRYTQNKTDGLNTITDIQYTICMDTGFIDITDFNIPSPNFTGLNKTHELTAGNRPFLNKRGATMGINWQRST
jgi:hypothetical protein